MTTVEPAQSALPFIVLPRETRPGFWGRYARWELFAFFLLFIFCSESYAACFGTSDGFVKVSDINVSDSASLRGKIPDPWLDGKHALGIHLRNRCFLLPYWSDNVGYAIYALDYERNRVNKKYWALDEKSIAQLQAIGVLPRPLPTNEVPFFETNQAVLLVVIVSTAACIIFLYLYARRQTQIALRVGERLEGNFFQLLKEVLADIASINSDSAQKGAEIAANFLARHGHVTEQANHWGEPTARGCARGELLIYIESLAKHLHSEQKKLILMGIATVLHHDNRISFHERRVFKSYIRALGVAGTTTEVMKAALDIAAISGRTMRM